MSAPKGSAEVLSPGASHVALLEIRSPQMQLNEAVLDRGGFFNLWVRLFLIRPPARCPLVLRQEAHGGRTQAGAGTAHDT